MRTELQTAILRARIARQTPQAVMERPSLPSLEPLPPTLSAGTKPIETPLPFSPVSERINKVHKVNRIINAACRHFDLPRHILIGPSKKKKFVYPRHIAMYAARQTRESFPEVGRRFGVDHSTVHHAVQKIAQRLIDDDRIAADCEDLARAIGGMV